MTLISRLFHFDEAAVKLHECFEDKAEVHLAQKRCNQLDTLTNC